MRRRGARAAALLLGGLLAPALAGCGIRATEVPTDFGPAPSRMPCASSASSSGMTNTALVRVRVYLLCAGQLTPVERSVRMPEGVEGGKRRAVVAHTLLAELTSRPSPSELQNGYRTVVPYGSGVAAARPGDPAEAFRLTEAPDRLPDGALAQIVCTFSESAVTQGSGAVLLGGPDGELTRYACLESVRSHPTTTPVPSTAAGAAG